MDVGQPSLDQLRVFLTVAEEGSFNRAAQRLGRAISVVSYAIGQLEGQLGVSLFSREGSRKPQLTPEGQALLAEARAVANDVDALVAKVRSLQQGLESELSLAVDVMVPGDAIARILREFQRMFPTVPLRLHVEALGAVAALVIDGQADIAIGGPVAADCPEVERQTIGSVELIPVAAPSHALAQMQTIPPGETRKHFQLVLTDRSPLTAGRDFSVLSPHSWRLADLGAKHVLLREGLGWGNMPRHMILDDLAKGALIHLDVPEGPRFDFQLSALWRRDRVPGPAAFWMLSAFQDARLGQP
ncbi:MAG: LysR family transcriptional regulator [Rhizobiaceae bacterium]|nr:MAG: LysR family transcriptional regulator [Rhizobiaceae bacterium]